MNRQQSDYEYSPGPMDMATMHWSPSTATPMMAIPVTTTTTEAAMTPWQMSRFSSKPAMMIIGTPVSTSMMTSTPTQSPTMQLAPTSMASATGTATTDGHDADAVLAAEQLLHLKTATPKTTTTTTTTTATTTTSTITRSMMIPPRHGGDCSPMGIPGMRPATTTASSLPSPYASVTPNQISRRQQPVFLSPSHHSMQHNNGETARSGAEYRALKSPRKGLPYLLSYASATNANTTASSATVTTAVKSGHRVREFLTQDSSHDTEWAGAESPMQPVLTPAQCQSLRDQDTTARKSTRAVKSKRNINELYCEEDINPPKPERQQSPKEGDFFVTGSQGQLDVCEHRSISIAGLGQKAYMLVRLRGQSNTLPNDAALRVILDSPTASKSLEVQFARIRLKAGELKYDFLPKSCRLTPAIDSPSGLHREFQAPLLASIFSKKCWQGMVVRGPRMFIVFIQDGQRSCYSAPMFVEISPTANSPEYRDPVLEYSDDVLDLFFAKKSVKAVFEKFYGSQKPIAVTSSRKKSRR